MVSAIIVKLSGFFNLQLFGRSCRQYDLPLGVGRRRGVRKKVAVYPFDGVAHRGGGFGGAELHIVHDDAHRLRLRRRSSQPGDPQRGCPEQEESTNKPRHAKGPSFLLDVLRKLLDMLLMALEDLE